MGHWIVWTLLFHIVGLVFWIGGLLVVTSLLGQHSEEDSVEGRGALERAAMRILNGMANPGAIISIVTGFILVSGRASYYAHALWFQAKAILVVCMIVLHGITYLRARRLVSAELLVPRKSWMVLHGAISLVFFLILICVLLGRVYWR